MPQWKTYADGEEPTVAEFNELMQAKTYATLAARDTASASFTWADRGKICWVDETGYYYYWSGTAWSRFPATAGAGAPVDGPYVTTTADATLTNETVHSALSGAALHDPKTHTHTESEISDLDHDAQKIKAKTVDAPAAGDDLKFLQYNHGASKFQLASVAGGGDMTKAVYDTDSDNKVDTAETLDDAGTPRDISAVRNHTPIIHKSRHVFGGADAFVSSDILNALALTKYEKGGVEQGTRRGLNFQDTASVTWSVSDDAANNRVNVQATATQAGSYKLAPSYTIYKVGSTYYAMDEDGNPPYSSSDADTVINYVYSTLGDGTYYRRILVKGDFTINNTLTATTYTILEVDGKIALANSANCYMMTATNKNHVVVMGGEWDGNKAGQGAVNLKGIQFNNVDDARIIGVYLHDVKADTMAGGRGLEFYGCERSKMIDCRVEDSDHNDFGISDGYDCQIIHCFSKGAANAGFAVGSVGTNYSDRHRVVDCTALDYGNHGFELYKECHYCEISDSFAYSTVGTADGGFKIGNVDYSSEPSNDNIIANCIHRGYGSGFVVDVGFRNTISACKSYDPTKYGGLIQGAGNTGYNQFNGLTVYSPTWEALKIDASKNICMNITAYACARNGVEIMDDGDENTISGVHITGMTANNPLKINAGATRNFITGFNMYGNSADVSDAGTNTMWGTNVDKDGNVDTDVEP